MFSCFGNALKALNLTKSKLIINNILITRSLLNYTNSKKNEKIKVEKPEKPEKAKKSEKPEKPEKSKITEKITKAQKSGKKTESPKEKTLEELYQKKTPIEHILLRPDTYVGSLIKTKQSQWIYNVKKKIMEQKECVYVPGLYKIFDEILVNAADHKQRDPIGMKNIKVEIKVAEREISIFNDGAGIPVEIHQVEGVYLPELLLGHLLTGSNFDDKISKITGGRNGYGAKLANIFSKKFTLETCDEKTHLNYKQTWTENMSKKCEPLIKHQSGKGFTKITFTPDLKLFNMSNLTGDIVLLMKRRVWDIAACLPQVNVYLDNQLLSCNFSELYAVNADKLVVFENPRWTVSIGVSESPTSLNQISFVNCIHTLMGGTHVNYITDQIIQYIFGKLKKKFKITSTQIKNHLIIAIKCFIDNPVFESQTKERLVTKVDQFSADCVLNDKFLKSFVEKTNFLEIIENQFQATQIKALSKNLKAYNKTKLLGIPKLDDANEAGGPLAKKCTLIITEGDSAKSLAISGLSVIGRDFYGVFPVQGKLLNVRDAPTDKVVDNKEIKDLIQAIGLNPQKTYLDWEKDSKSIRYGKIMLMTDQDPDGSHIKGLFINFIEHFWPNLLKRDDFLYELITPIIKATFRTSKTPQVLSFFTISEYEQWKSTNVASTKQWNIKYYKGLGTNTSLEAKEYFSNLSKHVIQFKWRQNSDNFINMAFNKKFASQRREWLLTYNPLNFVNVSSGILYYDDFINKELITFSHYDNVRSIPSIVDGLKPSQRKILYAAFKRKLHNEMKVVQFAGYVSEQTSYHHGEQSLHSTIINMAQDFVGSQNMPLLVPSGQFGTRLKGGKDSASPRYIFTFLSKFARLLFPEDDDALLNYLNDDGLSIEPEYYVPIIPLLLINGSEGLGTGWSTYIPTYHPLEVIQNIRSMMQGLELLPLKPFYKNFKGSIIPINEKTYKSSGTFQIKEKDVILINELPIGRWTHDYKIFLDELIIKKIIKQYSEHHTDQNISFTITSLDPVDQKTIFQTFRLEDFISTNNMTAFNSSGNLQKFNNPQEIIQQFYPVRLEYYNKRKSYKLKQIQNSLAKLKNQTYFIESVISGQIKLVNQPKKQIMNQLETMNFLKTGSSLEDNFSYLLSTPLFNLTFESVTNLRKECDQKEKELQLLESLSPIDLWKKDLDSLEEFIKKDKSFL